VAIHDDRRKNPRNRGGGDQQIVHPRRRAPPRADLAREIVQTYSQLRYDPGTSSPERVRDLQRLVKAFKP
jgi:hypothetical protein